MSVEQKTFIQVLADIYATFVKIETMVIQDEQHGLLVTQRRSRESEFPERCLKGLYFSQIYCDRSQDILHKFLTNYNRSRGQPKEPKELRVELYTAATSAALQKFQLLQAGDYRDPAVKEYASMLYDKSKLRDLKRELLKSNYSRRIMDAVFSDLTKTKDFAYLSHGMPLVNFKEHIGTFLSEKAEILTARTTF